MSDVFYDFLKKVQLCENKIKGYKITKDDQSIFFTLNASKHIQHVGIFEPNGHGGQVHVRYASLTPLGQEYINNFEKNSRDNISIVNSPNTNLVNQSDNVTITQNFGDIQKTVNNIKETIQTDTTIDKERFNEIMECLNEIEQNIKNGNKPKFAIKSLIDIAGGISSIASLIIALRQFI